MGHIHESHGAHIHTWKCNQAGKFVRPSARDSDTARDEAEQNHFVISAEEDESMEVDVSSVDDSDWALPTSESTVFVNAANSPLGRANRRDGTRVRQEAIFGGPGHQPVVVDLKDYPNERDL